MLCLGDDFAGYRARVAARVANHQQLARTRWRVDPHISADLELRLGHVRVAGPDDSVDARNGLRAVSHRRNGARAAEREDAIYSGNLARGENDRRRISVALRRRAQHDLPHTGNPRRNSAPSARCSRTRLDRRGRNADAPQRIGAATHDDAWLGLDLHGRWRSGTVNRPDIPRRALERGPAGVVDLRRERACRTAFGTSSASSDTSSSDAPSHAARDRRRCARTARSRSVCARTVELRALGLTDRQTARSSMDKPLRVARVPPSGSRDRLAHGIRRSTRVTRMPSASSAFSAPIVLIDCRRIHHRVHRNAIAAVQDVDHGRSVDPRNESASRASSDARGTFAIRYRLPRARTTESSAMMSESSAPRLSPPRRRRRTA